MDVRELGSRAKDASYVLARATTGQKNAAPRPVPEGLVYSSDRNPQRLDEFGLMRFTSRGRSAVA